MKNFLKEFELYIGSVFISITILVVIMNVFTRYVLKFTYFWAEEVAVGCFVWTVFLGTAAAYRKNALIGVEAIVVLLPPKIRKFVQFIVYILMTIISGLMFYFGFEYVSSSSKITAALEISYAYINSAIVISFGLMTIYSIIYLVKSFKSLFLAAKDEK